jgi:hypothetical protein
MGCATRERMTISLIMYDAQARRNVPVAEASEGSDCKVTAKCSHFAVNRAATRHRVGLVWWAQYSVKDSSGRRLFLPL